MSYLKRFIDNEDGATAIEYGLIAALVSVAIIVAVQTLGGNLSTLFTNIATTISTNSTAGGGGGGGGGGGT